MRRSVSSRTTQTQWAVFMWTLVRRSGLLAMSGSQVMPLFSEVCTFLLLCFLHSNILSDVCGKLEGESIVGKDIQDALKLWYFQEPSLSPTTRSPLSPIRDSPSPTVTETPTNSAPGTPIGDWREPIHQMLQLANVNINIRITDKLASPSPSHSPPSSPLPPTLVSSSDDSISPIELPKSPPPPLKLQIPPSSAGPSSPSKYYTPRSRPPSPQQTQVAGPPVRMPEPELPSTRSSLISHPQPAPLAATPSSAALPVLCSQQLPPVSTLPTERATLALPTTHVPGPQEGTISVAASCSLLAAGAPPLIPNVAIVSPLHVVSTTKLHAGGNEGVIGEPPLTQMPTPEHEDENAPGPVPAPPQPPPLPVQLLADDPQPHPQKQKRNWLKKIWDFIR